MPLTSAAAALAVRRFEIMQANLGGAHTKRRCRKTSTNRKSTTAARAA
jgi:hypothetical protein